MNPEAKTVVSRPATPVAPLARPTPPVAPTAALAPKPEAPANETPKATSKVVYRFAKLWGVAEILRFEDGSTFTFPLKRRNNMPGYSPTSSIETSDAALAANLRKLLKTNDSLREVVSKQ